MVDEKNRFDGPPNRTNVATRLGRVIPSVVRSVRGKGKQDLPARLRHRVGRVQPGRHRCTRTQGCGRTTGQFAE